MYMFITRKDGGRDLSLQHTACLASVKSQDQVLVPPQKEGKNVLINGKQCLKTRTKSKIKILGFELAQKNLTANTVGYCSLSFSSEKNSLFSLDLKRD